MNMKEIHEVTNNAIIPPPSTQPTTKNEPAIDPRLKRWIDFCEQTTNEAVDQNNYEAELVKKSEENRKAKAEKRLMAKLRKMEVEQKAVLLAEAQNKMEEGHRAFESQEHDPFDYISRPTSSIDCLFHEHKAMEELKALEREQKEELLRQVMDKRAKEAGDDWPRIQEMSRHLRYDHIPKYWPGEKEIIAKAFRGLQTAQPQETNE